MPATLERYWSERFGRPQTVQWLPAEGRDDAWKRDEDWQLWFGNPWLAVFAVKQIDAPAVELLRRRLGVESIWWRGLPGRLPIDLTVTHELRPRLAQVGLAVRPEIETASEEILFAGPRYLRVLNPVRGSSTVVLRRNVPPWEMLRALDTRRTLALEFAPQLRRASPGIEDALDAGGADGNPDHLGAGRRTPPVDAAWYDEDFIPGTPLDMLPAGETSEWGQVGLLLVRDKLVRPTLTTDTLLDHLDRVSWRSDQLLTGASSGGAGPIPHPTIVRVQARLRAAALRFASPSLAVPVAASHGALEAANFLRSPSGQVFVIDWTSLDTRHASHDALVYAVKPRAAGWSERLQRLQQEGTGLAAWSWPGLQSPADRRLSLLLFLLEQVSRHSLELADRPAVLAHHLGELKRTLQLLDVY